MKYLQIISFLFILLLTACDEGLDDDLNAVIINDKKISAITLNGNDLERFYYDYSGMLTEVQTDYVFLDSETEELDTVISSRYFHYDSSGKLDYVLLGSADTVQMYYQNNSLFIQDFHLQNEGMFMSFSDYESFGDMNVNLYYSPTNHCLFTAIFGTNNNFITALKSSGEVVEDSCPGYYYLSQYYGEYSYNEAKHPYSTLPLEVQFFLYQKPFVNCASSIQRNNKRIEYDYELDEDGYPMTSEAITIYPSGPDTLFHGVKTYIYQ